MADDRVECRLCGKRWRSLGHHLRWGHGLSPDEYRERFGIKRGEPLTSPSTRARFQALISSTIESGALNEHYAGNAERSGAAGRVGVEERARMRSAGHDVSPGAPALPRTSIESVVEAIEQGLLVASAVKRAGVSYSSYHMGLRRYADLRDRHYAARSPKGRK